MDSIQKTVFLSYRRTNIPWALAIFQNLTHEGFDVFFDYDGIRAGDFEQVILGNITSRAHFLVVLTPSALERCQEPGDWLRREIETAMASRRNIVPLFLEGFSFGTSAIANQLTGTLSELRNYNGLEVPPAFFNEAMERVRKFLNVPLTAVLHPASAGAQRAAEKQKAAATAAPKVKKQELSAQQWFEQGFSATDPDEKLRCYSEAIRLNPKNAVSWNNRGIVRKAKGDLDGAVQDYNEAIGRRQNYLLAYFNRGLAYRKKASKSGGKDTYKAAIADFQKYLDMGGGLRRGNQSKVEQWIRDLRKKL